MSATSNTTVTKLPTLTQVSARGKISEWEISVEGTDNIHDPTVIRTTWGFQGGAKQTAEKVISQGKNLGKSNATTPFTQAVAQATSTWKDKCSSGYSATALAALVALATKEIPTEVADIPHPMLAHSYKDQGHKIKFPCFAQPKLDGVRAMYIPPTKKGDRGKFFSRERKEFPHLEHLLDELALYDVPVLDGELYSKTIKFEDIVGTVRRKTLSPAETAQHTHIQYWIYDIIDTDKPFSERSAWIQRIFEENGLSDIFVQVQTEIVRTPAEIDVLQAKYIEDGYEGLMVRNANSAYRCKYRSYDLLKHKNFIDDDFTIVGFKAGEGKEAQCVIWTCETASGKQFDVRPRGTVEAREALLRVADDCIGKKLTVRYQNMTADGSVRFPVGITIRDYE